MPGLCFTDETEQELEKVDGSISGLAAAGKIYSHLAALSAYSQSQFEGSFFGWCKHSGDHRVLSPKSFAMRESETTTTGNRSREARTFKIATEVDPSGKIFMEPHTKPLRTGHRQVPRIYFFDDTAGATKSVHVGFIGPHDLIENLNK